MTYVIPEPSNYDPKSTQRLRHLFLAILVLGCSALRFIDLTADLPPWLPGVLTDEGYYADPARGKVLFNDYFSDDVGSAYLMAPLHTFLTEASFRLFGVGNWQVRMVPAACGSLLLAFAALWLLRRFGVTMAILGTLFIGFDPTLWVHCRFGLTESLQGLLIYLSALLLLGGVRLTNVRVLLSGAALGLALAAKLNSLTFGVVPILAGGLILCRIMRLHWKDGLKLVGVFTAGLLLIISLFAAIVWIPHWRLFLSTLHVESGFLSWEERVAALGLILSRGTDEGGQSVLWVVGRSPALLCASWLGAALAFAAPQTRAKYKIQTHLLIWVAMTAAVTFLSYRTWERRFVLLLPGLVLLCIPYFQILFSRQAWIDAQVACRSRDNRDSFGLRLLKVVMLTLPLLVLVKPWASNRMVYLLGSPESDLTDLRTGFAGLAVLAGWGFACILCSRVLSHWLDRAMHATLFRIGPVALLTALIFEILLVASSLFNAGHTLDEVQRELQQLGDGQDIVVGQDSSTVFLSTRLRTVRITYDNRFAAPPNPDVVDRLRPRFFMDSLESRLLQKIPHVASLYRPLREVAILREYDGSYRNRFRIWERQ